MTSRRDVLTSERDILLPGLRFSLHLISQVPVAGIWGNEFLTIAEMCITSSQRPYREAQPGMPLAELKVATLGTVFCCLQACLILRIAAADPAPPWSAGSLHLLLLPGIPTSVLWMCLALRRRRWERTQLFVLDEPYYGT